MMCPAGMATVLFSDTETRGIYTLSLHDALPISRPRSGLFAGRFDARRAVSARIRQGRRSAAQLGRAIDHRGFWIRSEEHTSELQSRRDLVCRLLLEKKK